MNSTALAILKAHGLDTSTIQEHLAHFLFDKGFTEIAEHLFTLPEGKVLLTQLLGQFVLALPPYEAVSLPLRQFVAAGLCGEGRSTYFGTMQENSALLESLSTRDGHDDPFLDEPHLAATVGKGVAQHFSLRGFQLSRSGMAAKIARTPLTFLGAGPATILLARTLIDAGFTHLSVIDPSGAYGGIWRQKNVRQASKNNPAPFTYEQTRVEAAPGSGEAIAQFLTALASPPRTSGRKPLPPVVPGKVVQVEPGNLAQQVVYTMRGKEYHCTTPLVIAALGQGKPLAPSRPGVMTTDTPEEAGIRWQQPLSLHQARALQGKTVVLIGLGNSTAEMLIQLQRYRDAGLDICIKVLTHYPREAIRYPFEQTTLDGTSYQLFRNPPEGQLTKLAGDLEAIRQAFERIRENRHRDEEELFTDVTHWSLQKTPLGKHLTITQRNGLQRTFACEQLYTLIGYQQPFSFLEALGMQILDSSTGAIAADYDGEVQRALVAPGRTRLYPGYFAAGALLKAPQSEHAQVIPGMLYRLPDQFFSICLRAAEYALLHKEKER